ncbi:hypothetical protein llap_15084 [Limosa lapponica baueri]|uniref:Uncharacterized protein n=1 Tax=Limosa lapponica baueri TaxID=1758121 RepID=A0A2I0TLK4_LIMLA|nr:hypothetical protein llap_15084 [Limosa lapponica baueri]
MSVILLHANSKLAEMLFRPANWNPLGTEPFYFQKQNGYKQELGTKKTDMTSEDSQNERLWRNPTDGKCDSRLLSFLSHFFSKARVLTDFISIALSEKTPPEEKKRKEKKRKEKKRKEKKRKEKKRKEKMREKVSNRKKKKKKFMEGKMLG